MVALANYAVIAAEEEIRILSHSDCSNREKELALKKIRFKLEACASRDDIEAQLLLASENLFGDQTNRKWLLKASASNNEIANLYLGWKYFQGALGFKQDFVLAADYLTKAFRSNEQKVLVKFKEIFEKLDNFKKIFKHLVSKEAFASFVLGSDLESLMKELRKHGIELYDYLERITVISQNNLSEDELAYLTAVETDQDELVLNYLERGGNPLIRKMRQGETALHKAVSRGRVSMVTNMLKYYKKYGLPVDSVFELYSPLSYACVLKNVAIATLLMQAGANPIRKYTDGRVVVGPTDLCDSADISDALNAYMDQMHELQIFIGANWLVTIKIGMYGAEKENFMGQIQIMFLPGYQSSENNPVFEAMNIELNTKQLPPLVKSNIKGGIEARLCADQAFHILQFAENTLAMSSTDQAELKAMKDHCYKVAYNTNPSTIFSLIKNSGITTPGGWSNIEVLPKDAATNIEGLPWNEDGNEQDQEFKK